MLLNFFYNLFFPLVFLFFLPGLVVKLIRRPGRKKNYPERFAIFSREKKTSSARTPKRLTKAKTSIPPKNIPIRHRAVPSTAPKA